MGFQPNAVEGIVLARYKDEHSHRIGLLGGELDAPLPNAINGIVYFEVTQAERLPIARAEESTNEKENVLKISSR